MKSKVRCTAWILAGIAAGVLCESAVAAAPRLRVNGSSSVGFDSNVGASQANNEKEDSAFYSVLLAADYVVPLSDQLAVTARGQVQGDAYDRFDELSNGRALGMVRLAWKPGADFFTPVLNAWASAARLEYGSEIRTGNEFRGGVYVLQQITTKIMSKIELKGFHREADGRVFDVSGQAASASLNWAISPVVSSIVGFEYQTGDATSSAAPSERVARAAEEIEPDDAFGGIANNQFAYRIDARTRVVTAGVNWRFAPDWAVDAQVQSISVDGDFGNQYDRLIGVIGLLVRF